MQLNQPAGHLESGESLIDAVIRETNEETAWQFTPKSLIGIYRWQHPSKGETYMRFCFTGSLGQHYPSQSLDADIHQVLWLTFEQIEARRSDLRSPLVMDCINDYLKNQRFSLEILHN